MPATTGPNLGLRYGYTEDPAESGWGANMTADLKKLDTLLHLSVKDRGLNTPPLTPTDGDRYIVGTSPTGVWTGHSNAVAVWFSADVAWTFYAAKVGWHAFVEDETADYVFHTATWNLV